MLSVLRPWQDGKLNLNTNMSCQILRLFGYNVRIVSITWEKRINIYKSVSQILVLKMFQKTV